MDSSGHSIKLCGHRNIHKEVVPSIGEGQEEEAIRMTVRVRKGCQLQQRVDTSELPKQVDRKATRNPKTPRERILRPNQRACICFPRASGGESFSFPSIRREKAKKVRVWQGCTCKIEAAYASVMASWTALLVSRRATERPQRCKQENQDGNRLSVRPTTPGKHALCTSDIRVGNWRHRRCLF